MKIESGFEKECTVALTKDISMKVEVVNKQRKTKYPIGALEINQSIELEGLRNRIAVICSTYGKEMGKKFKTNKTEKEGVFKVTRTA